VRLEAAHIINDTTLAASSEDDQKVVLNVDWNVRENWIVEGKIGYLDASFPQHSGGKRDDQYINAGIGVRYIMNHYMALKLAYDFQNRDSELATNTFDDNQVSLTLQLQE